jgi:hypothetical protein
MCLLRLERESVKRRLPSIFFQFYGNSRHIEGSGLNQRCAGKYAVEYAESIIQRTEIHFMQSTLRTSFPGNSNIFRTIINADILRSQRLQSHALITRAATKVQYSWMFRQE